jgi:hypothetical protein
MYIKKIFSFCTSKKLFLFFIGAELRFFMYTPLLDYNKNNSYLLFTIHLR